MRKIMIFAFLVFIPSFLFARINSIKDCYMDHTLKSISFFNGDKYGDFKNDLVAILSDDSAWKIHPMDQEVFSQWGLGDSIGIQVRTSFYWLKREHKFELFNDTRQETVRAMLIHTGDVSMRIVDCQRVISGYHPVFCTTIHSQKFVHYPYFPNFTYQTILKLNDHSQWIINESCHYNIGESVYIFADRKGGSFILVTGVEREATWRKIILESI